MRKTGTVLCIRHQPHAACEHGGKSRPWSNGCQKCRPHVRPHWDFATARDAAGYMRYHVAASEDGIFAHVMPGLLLNLHLQAVCRTSLGGRFGEQGLAPEMIRPLAAAIKA